MTDDADKDGKWHPYFAVLPVTVEAYDVSEIRNGRTSFSVIMQRILRRWDTWVDEDFGPCAVWRYRLVPKDGKIP